MYSVSLSLIFDVLYELFRITESIQVIELYNVSAQEARVQLSDMINRAIYSRQPSLISRQGKPAAVLISFAEWQAFQQWQQAMPDSVMDATPDPIELLPPLNPEPARLVVDPAVTTDRADDSK